MTGPNGHRHCVVQSFICDRDIAQTGNSIWSTFLCLECSQKQKSLTQKQVRVPRATLCPLTAWGRQLSNLLGFFFGQLRNVLCSLLSKTMEKSKVSDFPMWYLEPIAILHLSQLTPARVSSPILYFPVLKLSIGSFFFPFFCYILVYPSFCTPLYR